MPAPSLTYILAVHNDADILPDSLSRLAERLRSIPDAEILAVENGSQDNSADIVRALPERMDSVKLWGFLEPSAGLGTAWHRGLKEHLKRHPQKSENRWVVLTASDLPFGFTDLDAFLSEWDAGRARDIAIGSKAHHESRIERPPVRTMATAVFRGLRQALLGMQTRDCQGTLFLRQSLLPDLIDSIEDRGYFFSTELVYRAEQLGFSIVELPISLSDTRRASHVHLLRDGLRMLYLLIRLAAKSRTKNIQK